MLKRNDTAFRIFFRYVLTNILLLALPLMLSAVYYFISLDVIRTNVDTITTSQLSRSMLGIEKLLEDIDTMTAEDFIVPLSFDDVAVIRCGSGQGEFREEVSAFIEAVRADIGEDLRVGFSFGAGMPVPDPFLLIISCNQAASALSFMTSNNRNSFLFYDEIPSVKDSYFYPLDVEENVMKAVRSSNVDLLDSLIRMVRAENFSSRALPPIEVRNLFIALQGTVLRLLPDVPSEGRALRARLLAWMEEKPVPASLATLSGILHALVEAFDRGKKSHNSRLLEALEAYIAENYTRPDLGLTVIAGTFGRSENYLSNFFKEQTGECISEVIHRVRFERAAHLLAETRETIDRIALLCGYLNTGSFRRAFKRRSGLSPSEYKLRMNRRLPEHAAERSQTP